MLPLHVVARHWKLRRENGWCICSAVLSEFNTTLKVRVQGQSSARSLRRYTPGNYFRLQTIIIVLGSSLSWQPKKAWALCQFTITLWPLCSFQLADTSSREGSKEMQPYSSHWLYVTPPTSPTQDRREPRVKWVSFQDQSSASFKSAVDETIIVSYTFRKCNN